ncbi:MAG: hypothetical protein DDT23_01037 [candidate division WS2 bacterium]|nr:hypothetical protein [Candidatus Lithacetigena glycinireducens]
MKNPGKVRRLRRRTPRTARGKIRAIRYEDGWIMTFIGPKGDKGEVEYPAEGYIFKFRAETYTPLGEYMRQMSGAGVRVIKPSCLIILIIIFL